MKSVTKKGKNPTALDSNVLNHFPAFLCSFPAQWKHLGPWAGGTDVIQVSPEREDYLSSVPRLSPWVLAGTHTGNLVLEAFAVCLGTHMKKRQWLLSVISAQLELDRAWRVCPLAGGQGRLSGGRVELLERTLCRGKDFQRNQPYFWEVGVRLP